jgi:cobalt/nickel transport protein
METQKNISWFDSFTKNMLLTMVLLLCIVFGSAYYMDQHAMTGMGTDDAVNDMAATTTKQKHHPFIELPGDAEVSAFSIANLFAGLIVGYNWRKLSSEQKE